MKIFLCSYYIIINIILFIIMGIDKNRAKKQKWRIRESSLFTFAIIGGGIGGFAGMYIFHHKSKKPLFYIIYSISIIVHISLCIYLVKKGLFI